jgi:[ribosomal protein S18]-alanine N-acetyltransferase
MSAALQPQPPSAFAGANAPREAQFEPMSADWLDAVMAVEQRAYEHPWSRGNFSDSIQSGYAAQMLLGGAPRAGVPVPLIGYFVAMRGVDEVHLLNITVAPPHQGRGWARVMLDALALWSRGQGADWLWLEVRNGNGHARAVYEHCGFRRVGVRKAYYPAGPAPALALPGGAAQREDAIVMSLALRSGASS